LGRIMSFMSNHVIHVKSCVIMSNYVAIHVIYANWSHNVSQEAFSIKSGSGLVGGVKKCFQGLRQTASLSAEGKNINFILNGNHSHQTLRKYHFYGLGAILTFFFSVLFQLTT
jgi:hypothetical protein